MNVIAKRTLVRFWEKHNQAETPLKAWHGIVSKARWSSPQDVKNDFGSNVDFISDNRIIFDIAGNKYRLVGLVAYRSQRVFVRFIGTHKEYDNIDPETV
jgi:mRNA interferase HigB